MAVRFKKELQFRDYYLILFGHKFLILLSAVSFLGPTWYLRSRVPEFYYAYSQLAIENTEENYLLMTAGGNKKNLGYYNGLFKGRAFQEKLLSSIDTSLIPGRHLRDKKDFLFNNVKLSAGSVNSFMKVSCYANSPELSHKLVSVATDSLIVFCRTMENQAAKQALVAIREQIAQTTDKYNATLEEKNMIGSQGDTKGLAALSHAYEKLLLEYELEHADLQAQKIFFRVLDKKVNKASPVPGKLRKNLQKELSKLNTEKEKRKKLGLPLNPEDSLNVKVQALEKEIKALSKSKTTVPRDMNIISKWKESKKGLAKAESNLQYKKTKINALKRAIEDYKRKHPNLVKQEFEINRLNDLLARYDATHKRLTKRLEDELIQVQAQTGGLKLVEPAFLPTEPIPRKDMIFYIVALIMGLIVGIASSVFKEFLDDSVKTPEDIEKYLQLPLIGTIPHIVLRKNDLIIKRATTVKKHTELNFKYPELILRGSGEEGVIAEAYRSFRTNILFSSPDKQIQAFVVTSCGPHEGKSLTAANTALAFAQQGDPTILVDADLRRPIAHHLFHLERGPGLGDLFSDSISIESAAQNIEGSSLQVLTAGTFLPNAAESLGSNKFQAILQELREKYKYIIFDTPPIIAVTDACILSSKVDGTILIVRAEKTTLQAADRSVENLRKINSNILGCVLNDVSLSKNKGYYGYYKNYYHYYHTTKT